MRLSFFSIAGVLLQILTPALAADRIPPELQSFFWAREPLHALFGDLAVSGPTKNVLENQTQVMPDLIISSRMPYKPPFLFMLVDPDSASTTADPNNAAVSTNSSLSVTLHTLVSAVNNPTYYAINQTRLSPSTSDVLAPYIGPDQSDTDPSHNYTLFLFAQPASLRIPAAWQSHLSAPDLAGRANFPLGEFVSGLGLGQPICAMYFRLKREKSVATGAPTGAPTTSVPVLPSTTSTSTPRVVTGLSGESTYTVTTTGPPASTSAYEPAVAPGGEVGGVEWPWGNASATATATATGVAPSQSPSQNGVINTSSGSGQVFVRGGVLGWVVVVAGVMFAL